jgi:hypothetical protein
MALINCPECTSKISNSALNCPKCGVQIRKPRRGFFGMLLKWIFIAFNIFMLISMFKYFADIGEMTHSTDSDAAKVGATIGATIGTGLLLSIWGFCDIILGILVLLTRPKS